MKRTFLRRGRKTISFVCFFLLFFLLICAGCGEDESLADAEPVEEPETISLEEEQPEKVDIPEVTEPVGTVEEHDAEQSFEEEIPEEETEYIAEEPVAETPIETEEDNGYTFTEMTAVMYASSGLNVRDLPDKNGNSLGKLKQNEEISVTGQCNETDWYRIDYSGQTAYVSNEFVSSVPKEEEQTKTAQETGDGNDAVATGVNDHSGSGSSGGGGSNFDTYDNPEQQQTSASYVLNTNSKKFHLPNCSSVAKIAPQNYATANNRADIMAQGYQPCKKCNP